MRYDSPIAFRQALEDRLANLEAESSIPLARLRRMVAFDLFLRRLLIAEPDGWVLKGAVALGLRSGIWSRFTKDIDLGRPGREQEAIELVIAAQQIRLEDHFTFEAIKAATPTDEQVLATVRFSVTAALAGRPFETFPLDIALADPIGYEPDPVLTGDLLSFADIEPVRVPAIRPTRHIAEKVHAMTRAYGPASEPSTRPKDLIDILLIERNEELKADELASDLRTVFEIRDTHHLPRSLPELPDDWTRPFARLADEVELRIDLDAAARRSRLLVDPVLQGSATGRWDPDRVEWRAD